MNRNKEDQAPKVTSDSEEQPLEEFDEKLALKEQQDERDTLDENRPDMDDLLCDSPNLGKALPSQEPETTRNDAEFQHIFNQFESKDKEHSSSPNNSPEEAPDDLAASQKPPTTEKQLQADTSNQEQIPFDFNKFLTQMRRSKAVPITRYFKSFLVAFGRRTYSVSEQTKIIRDFLDFIYIKMRECDVWKNTSEQEFENAQEGMEKLVMNRLYLATFSPSTTDDKERDEILQQKISIFRWIRENHLDIPVTEHNESFMEFAQSELLKISHYKAPRDKMICILNCCKVIVGLLKHMDPKGETGADKFLPILIYIVVRANPPLLVSNVQYIARFRNPDHLQSEAGYYLTHMMGAISFIETMEANSLSITKEEFDMNIERTVNELKQERPTVAQGKQQVNYENAIHPARSPQTIPQPLIDSAKAAAFIEKGSSFAQKTMQKPLNFVGKIFQGLGDGSRPGSPEEGETYPYQSDGHNAPPTRPHFQGQAVIRPQGPFSDQSMPVPSPRYEQEQRNSLNMIISMFPNVEPEVCLMFLQANQGNVGMTIDTLLETSGQQSIPKDENAETNSRHSSPTSPHLPAPLTPPSHDENQSPRSSTKDAEEELIKL